MSRKNLPSGYSKFGKTTLRFNVLHVLHRRGYVRVLGADGTLNAVDFPLMPAAQIQRIEQVFSNTRAGSVKDMQ